MSSKLRHFPPIVLALNLALCGGCGNRTPLEEAEHLYLHSQFEQAIEACKSGLATASTDAEKSTFHLIIGRSYCELARQTEDDQSRYNDAIVELTQAIELLDNHEARYARSSAYHSIGEPELAGKDSVRARELDPDYPSAYVNEKPEEILSFPKPPINNAEEPETPIRNEPDHDEFVEEIVPRPASLSDQEAENGPPAGIPPRTRRPPKNQAAGFVQVEPHDVVHEDEPKISGLSEWLTQHNQRIALPNGSRDRYQLEHSPLLGEPEDSDEADGEEEAGPDLGPDERSTRWPPAADFSPTGLGNDRGGLPTTGIPTTGVPTSSSLPISGIPTTGIGGAPLTPTTGSAGFAGILPSAPTTGIGTAPFALPRAEPPSATVSTGLLHPAPTFRHGVSLPVPSGESTRRNRTPSAGVPPELAPTKPAPTTGFDPKRQLGPVRFQTSPLAQPQQAAPVPTTPSPTRSVDPRPR